MVVNPQMDFERNCMSLAASYHIELIGLKLY